MSLYRRGSVWWVDVYVGEGRKRVRKSTNTSNKVRAKIVEQTIIAVNASLTTRQKAMAIIDNVLPESERSLPLYAAGEYYRACAMDEGIKMTQSSMNNRVGVIQKFAAWAQRNTRLKAVSEVDAPAAFEFARALGTDITPKTKNSYIGDLATAWKLFMRHDKAKANPWPVVRVPRDKDREKTGRAFTQDEIERILIAAGRVGHDWPTAVVIALYTGLRQGDATSLKWRDIDFDSSIITCRPSKTAKHGIELKIPLHTSLADWLKAHRNSSEYVTPGRLGRVGKATFKDGDKPFNAILADAGISARDEREELSFHCFRHTFVSRLAEAGVAQDVRMRLAGHTSTTNHALYTHDDVSGRAAIASLPAISYTVKSQTKTCETSYGDSPQAQ